MIMSFIIHIFLCAAGSYMVIVYVIILYVFIVFKFHSVSHWLLNDVKAMDRLLHYLKRTEAALCILVDTARPAFWTSFSLQPNLYSLMIMSIGLCSSFSYHLIVCLLVYAELNVNVWMNIHIDATDKIQF